MTTYFKAVQPNGKDFHTGRVDYAAAFTSKTKSLSHPHPRPGSSNARDYLSVATLSTDCTGFSWPCRLFEVEPIGEPWTPHPVDMPSKRAVAGVTIVRELPAWQVFGPEGELILAIIDQFDALTDEQRTALRAERYKQYDAFWAAYEAVAIDGRADRAGLRAARGALYRRLNGWRDDGGAAYCAALAVLIRSHIGRGADRFTLKEYNTLSRPWRKVIGPIYPADKAVR